MSSPDHPSDPIQPPIEAAPSPGAVPPAPQPSGPPASPSAPASWQPAAPAAARGGRGWVWLVAIAAFLALLVGACAWSFTLLGSAGAGKLSLGNKIAVIRIDSQIAGTGSATGSTVTPKEFLDQIQQARDDANVKAIVLRVDSPGGTVAASEEISLYVKQTRKLKPIVVSIGDVGASGAYMISSQANRIVALPGSAVGSIGVITEIPNVSGLLDKVGVQFKVITAGKYKDAGSPFRPLTAEETALIQGQIDDVYGQFIDIVAEGRHMPRADVEKLATGWAWSGAEAKKLGLVDQIGTYEDALALAAKLGGIKDGDYEVVTYDTKSIDTLLNTLIGIERQLGNLGASSSAVNETLGRTALPK